MEFKTEQELVESLKAGNSDAFEKIVEDWQHKVYNTCFGFLKNAEDADDLAQEVFVEVFFKINQFKGDSALSTWLYRITVNKCLGELRKRKTKKRFAFISSLWSVKDESLIHDPMHFNHPGVLMENKERAAILMHHVRQLPENQQTAFILNKMEDMNIKEISEIMDKSISATEAHLQRAKQNLRVSLYHYYNS